MKGVLRMRNYSRKYQHQQLFIFSLIVLTLSFWSSRTNIVVGATAANIADSSSSSGNTNVPDYKRPASSSRVHSRGINDVVDDSGHHQPSSRDYDDYVQYDDDDEESELGHGHHLDQEDTEGIQEWEHEHSQQYSSEENARPSIAKCCSMGEALGADGRCQKVDPAYKHDLSWHPQSVYRVDFEKWTHLNLSEWDVHSPFQPRCSQNESAEILSDLGKFVLISDGGLFMSHKLLHLFPQEFCFDQQIGKDAGRSVMACFKKEDFGANSTTLRKCCPSNLVHRMVNNTRTCVLPSEPKAIPGNWALIYGERSCKHGFYLTEIDPNETIRVGNDGTFIVTNLRAPFLDYCVDYFTESESGEDAKLKVMMCLKEEDLKPKNHSLISVPPSFNLACGVAFIVSSICLGLAALISLRLPELRSLHGKCQLSHLATLFCLCVLLATAHLGGSDKIPLGLCTFFAVAIHFCALSSFLWLNLLCVNIYLTFRSLRPPLAARRGETRRLFFLCVYAWGIPAAFCLFLYVLDKPGTLDPMPPPEYGKLKCLISNREAEFAYLYGPVGILLLLNGLLFCLTAQELLCGLWRLDNSDSINFRRKSMGIVVAKLGIVMGMGWIFDVTSWFAGQQYPYLFYAADIFNSLQGLFIFIVLIWRKRVLEVLHVRKPSITKDETLTGRPFLHKNSTLSQTLTNGDQDTSLISAQDA